MFVGLDESNSGNGHTSDEKRVGPEIYAACLSTKFSDFCRNGQLKGKKDRTPPKWDDYLNSDRDFRYLVMTPEMFEQYKQRLNGSHITRAIADAFASLLLSFGEKVDLRNIEALIDGEQPDAVVNGINDHLTKFGVPLKSLKHEPKADTRYPVVHRADNLANYFGTRYNSNPCLVLDDEELNDDQREIVRVDKRVKLISSIPELNIPKL